MFRGPDAGGGFGKFLRPRLRPQPKFATDSSTTDAEEAPQGVQFDLLSKLTTLVLNPPKELETGFLAELEEASAKFGVACGTWSTLDPAARVVAVQDVGLILGKIVKQKPETEPALPKLLAEFDDFQTKLDKATG